MSYNYSWNYKNVNNYQNYQYCDYNLQFQTSNFTSNIPIDSSSYSYDEAYWESSDADSFYEDLYEEPYTSSVYNYMAENEEYHHQQMKFSDMSQLNFPMESYYQPQSFYQRQIYPETQLSHHFSELVDLYNSPNYEYDTQTSTTPTDTSSSPEIDEISDEENHEKSPTLDEGNESIEGCNIVSMDCEMVGVGPDAVRSILARVSIVDGEKNILLDTFVAPTEPVTDYRTHVSGVEQKDLAKAPNFTIVQEIVRELIDGKILVGHAIQNDLDVLGLSHPSKAIRDTAKFVPLRPPNAINRMPSLKNLSKRFLNKSIQSGAHCSIEDAICTLQIYYKFKDIWEEWIHGTKFPL